MIDSDSRRGGTISATTRPRSVTTTVSPAAASRTYSLSLFFRTFSPTVRMVQKWLLEATLSNRAKTAVYALAFGVDRARRSRPVRQHRDAFTPWRRNYASSRRVDARLDPTA